MKLLNKKMEDCSYFLPELSQLLLLFMKSKNISGGNIVSKDFLSDFNKEVVSVLNKELHSFLSKKFNVNEVKILNSNNNKFNSATRLVKIESILIDFKFEKFNFGFIYNSQNWLSPIVNGVYFSGLDNNLLVSFFNDSISIEICMPNNVFFIFNYNRSFDEKTFNFNGNNILKNFDFSKNHSKEIVNDLKSLMYLNEILLNESVDKYSNDLAFNRIQDILFLNKEKTKEYFDFLSLTNDIEIFLNEDSLNFLSDINNGTDDLVFLRNSKLKNVLNSIKKKFSR